MIQRVDLTKPPPKATQSVGGYMVGQRCLAPWRDGNVCRNFSEYEVTESSLQHYEAVVEAFRGDQATVRYTQYNERSTVPIGFLLKL